MKFTITSLNSDDLEALLDLSEQLGYPNSIEEVNRRFSSLAQNNLHALFKISVNEVMKGWIHLEKVFDLIEETKVEIKAMVVDEHFRGKGLGSALVNHAKIWAREHGLNTIYLSCNIVRKRTHDFYKREGFSPVKTSHFFELVL